MISEGFEQLEAQWNDVRQAVAARARGYFTPDEDDRVRQMLLAYRNYRLALYAIIYRYYNYRSIKERVSQLRGFLLAFASVLTLAAKWLRLVDAYEHEPFVRKKLNEPDAKYGLAPGFFEEVLRNYISFGKIRVRNKSIQFWQTNHGAIQQLRSCKAPRRRRW